ncbi:MAG: ATP-binding protein [Clostridia bacterium]|nr:ATP-binding protein [Clostridia bacterium]
MLNITKGKINRAQKVVIYGPEGIGKSSLAARFPDPVIIDTEGGTAHMDVRRIDKPSSWEELLSIIKEVAATEGICKTLVIDTADWAEQLIAAYLCSKYKQNSIESFGYGKGYTYLAEEFSRLLSSCDLVIAAGIHVVVTAHAKMRKFEQPDEMGAYDRWEMKLSKQTAPLLKEWCDMLLFCNYQTFVVTSENDTKKAQGGKRVIYTSHHPAWDAKSRIKLPDIVDLDYSNIAFAFEHENKKPSPSAGKDAYAYEKLREMMGEAGVTEEEVRNVVVSKGHFAEDVPVSEYGDKFITGWVIKYWPQIIEIISNGGK